jgi:hypothetical protein
VCSTARMTGVAKNTIVKLLADVGKACAEYHDKNMWDLPCKRVQCDEIWPFCYAKQRNVPEEHAIALHFMHYSFCGVHQTLKKTSAMAAGLAEHPWTIRDIVELVEGGVSQGH